MKIAFLVLLSLANALLASAAEPEAPATFLPSPDERLRRVLETPVSGDFHATPIAEVINRLFQQLHANVAFKSGKHLPPTYTGTFEKLPFRTALFRVVHATGYTAEWTTREDGARLMSIHEPEPK
jgi:hypothetical protein